MKKIQILILIVAMLFCASCSNAKQDDLHSWAFDVVTWDNAVYKVTNEIVYEVEEQIGTIKKYSTHESDHLPNLFSNKYKKGTKLFKIKNIEANESIAVLKDDTFLKALKMDGMKTAA